MNLSLPVLGTVMRIIAPLKIYQLQHDGLNDPEYKSRRDVVRLYQTQLIEKELRHIAKTGWVKDKNYAKALFDEYVFHRIDWNVKQIVMDLYAAVIQEELLK